jgi:hypothetical protein
MSPSLSKLCDATPATLASGFDHGCHCVPIAGRCFKCDEVLAIGVEKCPTCGWPVKEGELKPVSRGN